MSLPQSYFDRLYSESDDPWGFRTRAYEARKRDLTLASLAQDRYRSVFEPGSSIGVLTAMLARRTDSLVAMDISELSLRTAAQHVPPNVELRGGAVPADWPPGHFDLVVLSEVGYYLDDESCARLADLAMRSADEVVAVHWRHPVSDYPLTGDQVHGHLARSAASHGLVPLVVHRETDVLVESWSRDTRSIATRAGLVG